MERGKRVGRRLSVSQPIPRGVDIDRRVASPQVATEFPVDGLAQGRKKSEAALCARS